MWRFGWIVLMVLGLITGITPTQAQETGEISHIGRGVVQSVEWHADGDYLLVSTITGAWFYTPDLKDLRHFDGIQLATLSPDGRYIAGVDANSRIRLWDARTFEPVESPDNGIFRQIDVLAWSPNARYLAASDSNGESLTYAWDFADERKSVIATYIAGDRLAWSPAETQLAIYGSGGLGQLYVFHLDSSVAGPTFIKWSGSQIAWQDETHLLVMSLPEMAESTAALLWDITTGKELRRWELHWPSATYNHSGNRLAVAGFDLSIYDATSNQKLTSTPVETEYYLMPPAPAWSHNDRWIATTIARHAEVQPCQVGIIDAQTGNIVHALDGLEQAVLQISWSPDDRKLAVVDTREQLVIYDTEKGRLSSRTNMHTLVGEALAWSPDATRIVLADSLNSIRVWDVQKTVQESVSSNHRFPVTRIKWQPDGDLIAAQGHSVNDRQYDFQIWNWRTAINMTRQFQPSPEAIEFFAWSPNGEQLATVLKTTLSILNIARSQTHEVTNELPRGGHVQDIVWSPSGRYIVFPALGDGTDGSPVYDSRSNAVRFSRAELAFGAIVWTSDDTLTSLLWGTWGNRGTSWFIEPLLRYSRPPDFTKDNETPLRGMTFSVDQGFLSPDGQFAAAIDQAGNGMIWNTRTHVPVTMLANVSQVVWSPDETQLVVLRTDGSLWLLDASGTIQRQLPRPSGLIETKGQFFWSPDGGKLAYLHNGVVDLWRLN